ncbi:hypothetical protein [Halocatena halophila]|uniref:hypothetical protein n=1 Tax=Halocatena halophila TaxID=2814576 RepID=UPI002ED1FD38
MDRRTYLRTLSPVIALAGGCISLPTDDDEQSPDGVSTEFSILSQDPSGPMDHPPKITIAHEKQLVTVRGKLWRGNSCETVKPSVVEYDTGSRRFNLVIAALEKETPLWVTSCQPALGAIEYELTARFQRTLPTVVTVTEQPTDGYKQQRAAKTVQQR